MPTRNILLAAIGLIAAASVGLACGPFFPMQLLDNRTAILAATPNNTFVYEVAHLVAAPTDSLRAFEPGFNQSDFELDEARAKAEAEGLTSAQVDVLTSMRRASSTASAMAQGQDLPAAVRLYTVGALAFRFRDYQQAADRFAEALALPEAERAMRATWAAYMLGRAQVMMGNGPAATDAFALTRKLALAGAPDPLGLAVASYGEEARLHLPEADDTDYGKEIAIAVALYAEQAARGSQIAVESERMIAEQLLGRDNPPTGEAALPAAIGDPMTQRMLVAYALARIEEGVPGNAEPPVLTRLIAAIEATGNAHPPGADRLAALCYRIGRYDLAETLAGQSDGPLAAWVKAKLALHRGDLDAAAGHYAEASRAFPDAKDAPLDDGNRSLLRGEQGVLTLARGDYVGALAQLYPLSDHYWGDVQHIADRVLTVDELKRFVDAHVPEAPPRPPRTDRPESEWWVDPATQLRSLLARRLVREGRLDDALPYFPSSGEQPMRDIARTYAAAMHDATARWWTVDRAKAWYDASVLAREHGLEIMGSEGPPDYLVTGGNLHCCVGQGSLDGAYITDGERDRFAASKMSPDKAYHYRFVAADSASRAADLLPPRSQAFAAVLCKATGYVMDKDLDAERVLYQRYLKQGAHVSWATHFGRDCPEPDFAEAARFPREQAWRDARHFVSLHRWPIGGGAVVVLAAGVWLLRRRRFNSAGPA